jgi:hypothetical protein
MLPNDAQDIDFIESNPPINPPNILPNPPKYTFRLVEDRLIEAWQMLMRLPDREAGWLSSGTMSVWRMVTREVGDAAADDAPMARTSLTSREVDRMNETLAWLDLAEEGERKLIGLAIRQLASGASRVRWRELNRHFGRTRGTGELLRKRYSRAIMKICMRLNPAENRPATLSSADICEK